MDRLGLLLCADNITVLLVYATVRREAKERCCVEGNVANTHPTKVSQGWQPRLVITGSWCARNCILLPGNCSAGYVASKCCTTASWR